MKKKTKRDYRILPNVIITIIGLFMVVVVVKGWTAPTAAPPAGNVAVPINIGANAQTKIGGIGTLGGMVANSALFGTITLGGVTRNSWPTFPGETDPTVPSSIKDGISWGEVSGRPGTIQLCHCSLNTQLWYFADGDWRTIRMSRGPVSWNDTVPEYSFTWPSNCKNAGGTCDFYVAVYGN